MSALFIEEIIAKLKRGELRIPAFQRGFVWSPDDVAFLMDSIYKSYPFGGVLLWRTKSKLAQERALGPFIIPEPTADYPIDYVLDGQQRITSILGVFATNLPKTDAVEWRDIYFDMASSEDTQSSQFSALEESEVDLERHFPLNIIFDSTAYRQATKTFEEPVAERLDELKKRFQQAQLPYSMVVTEEKPKIAIVFERINRKGVPLDTFQLLSAWTWSEEFELKQQFEELAGELEPFGFDGIGEDTDLLLRCAAAVLISKESAESLLNVSGTEVRDSLPSIKKGLRAAIDFLKVNMKIEKFSNLPYPTLLIPLTAFFSGPEGEQLALTNAQVQILKNWFWRAIFSRRYSSATKRNLEVDIREAKRLRAGETSSLGSFEVVVNYNIFSERKFIAGTVDTKAFILMLAAHNPKSIVNGGDIQIGRVLAAGNKSEFHHIYPQAFLKDNQVDPSQVNCLANFCMLSASDNKKVGSKSPSKYRDKLAPNVDILLPSNLIPPSMFSDNFLTFVEDRSKLLVSAAYRMMDRPEPVKAHP